MSKRDDLAHRIIDSLDRHGDSYGLVKGPSDLAYLVADDLLAAPSPALTREALAAALLATTQEVTDAGYTHGKEDWADAQADAILTALGTPPPAPTSTREETE